MKSKRSKWLTAILVLVVLFGLVQLIPYGRAHANPAVVNSPVWNSTQTADMVKVACMDCHSNETIWPWYSNIAPASWLLQADVDEGRSRFNMSKWPTSPVAQQGLVDEMVRVIQDGRMPPFQYLIIHKDASFSAAEKAQLIQGLQSSVGQ
jgi:hypothetical protein